MSSLSQGGLGDSARLDAIGVASDDPSAGLVESLALPPDAAILDLGCGTGAFAARVKADIVPNGRVVALDKDAAAVRSSAHRGTLVIVEADARTWQPPAGDGYDLIHARYVLAHLCDARELLARTVGWLNPRGHLIITEPVAVHLGSASHPSIARMFDAYHRWVGDQGMSLSFAAAVPGIVARLGAVEVSVHTRATRCGGGPGVDRWAGLIGPVAQHLGEYGITDAEVGEFVAATADPHTYEIPQVIVTTHARF